MFNSGPACYIDLEDGDHCIVQWCPDCNNPPPKNLGGVCSHCGSDIIFAVVKVHVTQHEKPALFGWATRIEYRTRFTFVRRHVEA